ncbi:MAG: YceI family protein [Dehalococcoidia bacterium]|nr:YceI family protein [Dehalococcoidia bacterium]
MTARPGLMLGVAAVVAAALFGGWYFLIRGDEPPPVSLAGAVASVADSTTAPTAAAPAEGASTASTATPAAAAGSLEGTWMLVAADSFVGYRVKEQLVSVGATEAVGRTSAVTGLLEFDGSAITAVEVVADLTRLKSDDDRRDGRLRTQGIQWGTFPEASFVLAQPIAIDGVPAEGETISATAIGDLTLHGVTNRVEFPLQGTLSNGLVVVVGSLLIQFADYDMEAPSALSVVSVEEQGVIELQMVFSR